jgi:four helix bundle protein
MGSDFESWQELLVWQKAHAAVLEVYKATKTLPPDERFRLTDQLCRSAASVPTNIAEGKGRNTAPDFRHFLIIARGSTEETRYLLLLARDLGYLPAADYSVLSATYTEVSKMLNGLLKTLR